MTTWYVPLILLAVFGICIWNSRNVLRAGEVEIYTYKVRDVERPGLFWFLVFVHVFGMIAMMACLIFWAFDYYPLRQA